MNIVNLAAYYLLPMVELSKSSFGDAGSMTKNRKILELPDDSNLVNVYLSTSNMIVVKVRDIAKVPDEALAKSYYFSDYQVEEDGVIYTIILYRVTQPYLEELDRFRNGKYSHFREITKDKISIFNNWDKQQGQDLYDTLYRSERLRKRLEDELDVRIPEDAEVRPAPSEKNFIDLSKEHVVLQTIQE